MRGPLQYQSGQAGYSLCPGASQWQVARWLLPKAVEWEIMSIFGYNADGRLAEEWVQTDYRSFLQKLGAPSSARSGAAGSSSGTP